MAADQKSGSGSREASSGSGSQSAGSGSQGGLSPADVPAYEARLHVDAAGLWVSMATDAEPADPPGAAVLPALEEAALLLPAGSPLRLTLGDLGALVEATAADMRVRLEGRRALREALCRRGSGGGGAPAP